MFSTNVSMLGKRRKTKNPANIVIESFRPNPNRQEAENGQLVKFSNSNQKEIEDFFCTMHLEKAEKEMSKKSEYIYLLSNAVANNTCMHVDVEQKIGKCERI